MIVFVMIHLQNDHSCKALNCPFLFSRTDTTKNIDQSFSIFIFLKKNSVAEVFDTHPLSREKAVSNLTARSTCASQGSRRK